MSSPDLARTSSLCPGNSDGLEVEAYFFACGHGDTILLHFPQGQWALIDCYLPKGDIRTRFFEFVESKGITRLEWIFQTHPDFDHFFGMTHVLDYFTRDGRTVGLWCDGGLNTQAVQSLIWPDAISKKRYTELQRRLDELDQQDRIAFVELNDRVEPTSPREFAGRVDLFPVGPSARTKRRVLRGDLEALGRNPAARLEANALSIILALAIRDDEEDWNVLLPGDAGPEELAGALEAWDRRSQAAGKTASFDAIKVPHHGSLASHLHDLCRAKRKDRNDRFAVISAGERPKLPDREVIRDYLNEGWTVMSTTRRRRRPAFDRPMTLADRSGSTNPVFTSRTITLSWRSGASLSAAPADAIVSTADLDLYETAADRMSPA